MKETPPKFVFLCLMDALVISLFFMKVSLQVGSLEHSETFCVLQTVPLALPWGTGTASLNSSLRDSLITYSGWYNLFWKYMRFFPTDWEDNFPAQLTHCSPEGCELTFSSPTLLCKQLPTVIHYLTSGYS